MNKGLVAKNEVEINAYVSEVWNALIDPELIKQYLFGTEAISEWKVGSYIFFRGTWEGNAYEDKGLILKIETNKIFQYSYWTSFSGLEDKLRNYVNITYELVEKGSKTLLSITQDSVLTEEMVSGISENWGNILIALKDVVEKNNNE